jgi:cell shape-determining protein MreD
MTRWGFFAALLVALLLQSTVLNAFSVRPFDLLFALALVCGLLAPVHEARLAAWTCGLVQGLDGISPLGVHALAYGLAGAILTSIRASMNLELWWVRLLIALAAACPAQMLVLLHLRFWEGAATLTLWRILLMAIGTAFAAATLAALLTGFPGLLLRSRRSRFGLHRL